MNSIVRTTITYKDGTKQTRKFKNLDESHAWMVWIFDNIKCAQSGHAKDGYKH